MKFAVTPLVLTPCVPRIAIVTTINRIAIITTINRIAIITTINRIAILSERRSTRASCGRQKRSRRSLGAKDCTPEIKDCPCCGRWQADVYLSIDLSLLSLSLPLSLSLSLSIYIYINKITHSLSPYHLEVALAARLIIGLCPFRARPQRLYAHRRLHTRKSTPQKSS